jgi:hypothetical protein
MNKESSFLPTVGILMSALPSRQAGFLLLTLIIGLVLTGCSSGLTATNPTTQPTNTPIASRGNAVGQNTNVRQSSPATPQALPGTEEYGLSMAELVTSIEAVEGFIAECMNDAGFEYIAVDFNTVRRGMTSDKSLPGVSDSDFIAQYGFGISTLYTGLALQLGDLMTPAQIGLGEQNIQIFNNLSPTDQVAYNRTLFGEHPDATFAVALEVEDFSRTEGCTRSAIEQVFSPEQLNATYSNPKDALIEQDPRMVEALADFAECMRTAGFDYNHEKEIERDFRSRLDAITKGVPLESLSADALTALTALQDEERAAAAATSRCESTVLDPVESEIERELYAG